MNPARAEHVFRVFYRDYAHAVSIASSQPEALVAGRVRPLAERLLDHPDNFLGVVDRHDTILQVYSGEEPGWLVLELVYAEATGCLRLQLARSEALERLATLPAEFDESLLPGGQYLD
jgi:hypothetical protein